MATEVAEWAGGKLANAEFLDYAKEIARVATAFDTEKIPVAAPLAELKTVNARLVDFINETRTSDKTATIAELDAKRDALFRALESAVDIITNVGDNTGFFGHAAHLANVIGAYKGLAKHSLAKETQEIDAGGCARTFGASLTPVYNTPRRFAACAAKAAPPLPPSKNKTCQSAARLRLFKNETRQLAARLWAFKNETRQLATRLRTFKNETCQLAAILPTSKNETRQLAAILPTFVFERPQFAARLLSLLRDSRQCGIIVA